MQWSERRERVSEGAGEYIVLVKDSVEEWKKFSSKEG